MNLEKNMRNIFVHAILAVAVIAPMPSSCLTWVHMNTVDELDDFVILITNSLPHLYIIIYSIKYK